jgi:2-oxoglutarate ferredoxin oxidoreductase subunit beta
MDNEIYGLTKGQVAPTTPHGDKTKSTFWGNPEPSVDPCEMAISVGATWVGRGFSADVKFLTELMVRAIEHHGFSFLNIMSPCITFRGMNTTKEFKEKLQRIPDDHDRTDRRAAVKYTRETEVLTTGVLYEVEQLSLMDHLQALKAIAKGFDLEPSTRDVLKSFYPEF